MIWVQKGMETIPAATERFEVHGDKEGFQQEMKVCVTFSGTI
jgi:hypothetical protein